MPLVPEIDYGTPASRSEKMVTLTIDGQSVTVPEGTSIMRAAMELGTQIPKLCATDMVDAFGSCRLCLVEIEGRNGTPASCTTPAENGMVVRTQHSSPVADKAQQGVMELLLINHPLDCPVCDKGGECPLQNQAMTAGRAISRFEDSKRTYPKPINISSQVLLDRERCVLCARCTRFSDEIAGDPFIALVERGAQQQIGIAPDARIEVVELRKFLGTVAVTVDGVVTELDPAAEVLVGVAGTGVQDVGGHTLTRGVVGVGVVEREVLLVDAVDTPRRRVLLRLLRLRCRRGRRLVAGGRAPDAGAGTQGRAGEACRRDRPRRRAYGAGWKASDRRGVGDPRLRTGEDRTDPRRRRRPACGR